MWSHFGSSDRNPLKRSEPACRSRETSNRRWLFQVSLQTGFPPNRFLLHGTGQSSNRFPFKHQANATLPLFPNLSCSNQVGRCSRDGKASHGDILPGSYTKHPTRVTSSWHTDRYSLGRRQKYEITRKLAGHPHLIPCPQPELHFGSRGTPEIGYTKRDRF